MCYTLYPLNLFAYLIIQIAPLRSEISYKELRNIRYGIEKRSHSIYVEITRIPILDTTKLLPEVLYMEDTKVVFNYANLKEEQKAELKECIDAIPSEFKKLLDEVVSEQIV
jgi:hypothetical protein